MGTSTFGFGNTDQYGDPTNSFNWGDLLGQGTGTALSGLQGFFPQTQNTNTTGSSNSNTNTSGNQSGQTSQLLQSLAQLMGSSQTQSGTQNTLGTQGNALLSQMQPLLNSMSTPFNAAAYTGAQDSNINSAATAQQNNANQQLAARGLASSPTAAVTNAGIDASRIGQQTQVQNTLPQVEQAYNTQNLNNLSGVLSQLPRNSTTQSNQQQQQTSNSNQSGSGTSNSTMNGNSNTNTNSNQQTQAGPSGGFSGLLNGVGSALGALFGI